MIEDNVRVDRRFPRDFSWLLRVAAGFPPPCRDGSNFGLTFRRSPRRVAKIPSSVRVVGRLVGRMDDK